MTVFCLLLTRSSSSSSLTVILISVLLSCCCFSVSSGVVQSSLPDSWSGASSSGRNTSDTKKEGKNHYQRHFNKPYNRKLSGISCLCTTQRFLLFLLFHYYIHLRTGSDDLWLVIWFFLFIFTLSCFVTVETV